MDTPETVPVMSMRDFIRITAPPPGWLQKAWSGAKRRGLDVLMPDDINTEIDAHRREKAPIAASEGKLKANE